VIPRVAGLLLALAGAAIAPVAATAAPVFQEDFADNAAGWTLGPEWQIGSATASAGQSAGNPDPASDHTESGDNGVAGTVIGGNLSTTVHGFHYLESPAMDLTGVPGAVALTFWRWLNLDHDPFMRASVEVFDGASWVLIFQTGGILTTDAQWAFHLYDVTPYKNAQFRVRFGHMVGSSSAHTVSGWNLDDVSVGPLADVGVAPANPGWPSPLTVAPNPAHTLARIDFEVNAGEIASVDVLDVTGRVVRRLVSGSRAAGRQQVLWDGRDERGERVASGIYVVRFSAGSRREARRLVWTR
jgi:hypothetical protein